jgi:polysaccharide biosynthesis/export protein
MNAQASLGRACSPSRCARLPIVRVLAVAAGLLHLAVVDARAEYRLQPDDVLEFSVAGVQDLRQRMAVNLDGDVSLPLVGPIHVAGSSLSDLRARLMELLPSKVLRQAVDGKELLVVVGPDDATINIAEYRPVYVVGDVAKPGEQPYRPGMTVRQAISLAGGVDIARLRVTNPFLEAADFRGEYDALWAEFAKQQATLIRLKAELDNASKLDIRPMANVPVSADVLSELMRLEAERLSAGRNDLQKELTHLQQMIDQARAQHAYLAQQHIESVIEQQTADVGRVRNLYGRGLAPLNRVTDEQRSLWFASERLLQTAAQAAQVRRNEQELSRQLEKTSDHRRMDLLKEIEGATVKLSAIRARLSATAEKLVYAGAARARLGKTPPSKVEIRIYRSGSSEPAGMVASPELEVQPGVVIEVTLQRDYDIETLVQ